MHLSQIWQIFAARLRRLGRDCSLLRLRKLKFNRRLRAVKFPKRKFKEAVNLPNLQPGEPPNLRPNQS